ncbi:MAG: TAXI family TRAP transporter solute-binding subunit [Tissierellia bacterium]|nr:TAXI family TRAP transporter solute-binding subunit [Tissierellia bacterium]
MNKKRIIILAVLILILTACKAEDKANINMPTAATTGALYPLGSALANLWNQNIENINVSAQASDGGIDNLNLLSIGEAQVSMAVISNVRDSYLGLGKFENNKNPDLRIIAGLYLNPNQVVVSKTQNINSLSDLKDKRFVSGAPGSTTEEEAGIHLKASGLNYPEDLKIQNVGFTEAVDLMRNKMADGCWIMAGIPNSAVEQLLMTTDSKLISIEDDIFEKLKAEYPFYIRYEIPANTYEKQSETIYTTAIKMVMFTDKNLDESIVYEMTKVFWENLDELSKTNKMLKDLDINTTLKDLADIPIHDGAMKYYKEMGLK